MEKNRTKTCVSSNKEMSVSKLCHTCLRILMGRKEEKERGRKRGREGLKEKKERWKNSYLQKHASLFFVSSPDITIFLTVTCI